MAAIYSSLSRLFLSKVLLYTFHILGIKTDISYQFIKYMSPCFYNEKLYYLQVDN